jgi:hypothetical protein
MKHCPPSLALAVEGRIRKKVFIAAGVEAGWRNRKRPIFQNASCAVMEIVLE